MPLADPADGEADLQKLLHYTGGVPFFLFHFLSVARTRQTHATPGHRVDFDSCWDEFVRFPPIRMIGEHLGKSLQLLIDLKDTKPATYQSVRTFLANCITDASVGDLAPTDYDCRYFWRDESRVGRCLNGFVRDSMAMLLHELRQYAEWMAPAYVFNAITGSRNPSVRGFLAEQACISSMLTSPAEYLPGLSFRPSELRYFDRGSESSAFVHDVFCVLYVPRPFNYKAVDAVLRILPVYAKADDFRGGGAAQTAAFAELQKSAAVILPVQITLRSIAQHASSVAAFFAARSVWLSNVIGADGQTCTDKDASWIFHWIVPKKVLADGTPKRHDIGNEEQRVTRTGVKVTLPRYSEFIRTIEEVTGRPDLLRTPPASPSK